MEFLLSFGWITTELFIDFFVFGVVMNILGWLIILVFSIFRVSTLSPEELEEYTSFLKIRNSYIKKHSTGIAKFINSFSILFPMHTFIIAIVFSYYLIRYAGITGILGAVTKIEKFQLVPQINYVFTQPDK